MADARDGLVVEIVERLDGIPLAIELAAARTRTMELGELRDRLDDRFRLLSGGSRRSGQRQATLDGAFALDAQHSRRLLNEELDRWSLTRRPIDKPTARPT